jgi:hypothetical protein
MRKGKRLGQALDTGLALAQADESWVEVQLPGRRAVRDPARPADAKQANGSAARGQATTLGWGRSMLAEGMVFA